VQRKSWPAESGVAPQAMQRSFAVVSVFRAIDTLPYHQTSAEKINTSYGLTAEIAEYAEVFLVFLLYEFLCDLCVLCG
jgi:hypothetical protein